MIRRDEGCLDDEGGGRSPVYRTREDRRRVSGCGRGVESADDVEK